MSTREEDILPWMRLPKIEFTSDQTRIRKGASVSLRWDAGEASEVKFWKSTFVAPGPLDWWRISQQGEKVEAKGEIRRTQEEATVYYLVAKTLTGMRGASIVVDVVEEEKPRVPPITWCPPDGTLPRMKDTAAVAWLVPPRKITPAMSGDGGIYSALSELILENIWKFLTPSPPVIKVAASPEVIFLDESAVLSWNVSNASCIDIAGSVQSTGLIPDPTQHSGTALDGGSIGFMGSVPCVASQSGSWTIAGNQYGHQAHVTYYVTAKNALGGAAGTSQWLDILSVPQFSGSYAARSTAIRNAIRDIDKRLRGGSIYNDTALNTNIDAFKKGQMSRTGLWADLLVALQNLKLVTFKCIDLAPSDPNPCGQWDDFTNEIRLYWQPGYSPYLEYIILHELVHKCGFNKGLLKFGYSQPEIETQACRIACACYPDCGICDCCVYSGGKCSP